MTTSGLGASQFAPLTKILSEFFAGRAVPAFLMGGAVRDALLGRPTGDIDLAVEGEAVSLGRELASTLDAHLIVLDEARNICRVAGSDDSGAWHVDIARAETGIVNHLRGRDCTVDAMAIPIGDVASPDLFRGLIDPADGLSDLRAGQVRMVSGTAFEDDPGRLMRAPRIAVQLGFEIESDTRAVIRRNAALVRSVAPERTRDELLALLAEPDATTSLRLLDGLGLLGEVIPELEAARGVLQPKEHHWGVFDHLVETAGQIETVLDGRRTEDGFTGRMVPRLEVLDDYFDREASDGHSLRTLLKLGGLLHDVAKPATKTVEPTGRIRFLGHHSMGAEMVRGILNRLRLSGRGTDLLCAAVQHHLRPAQMAQKGEMPTGRAIFRFFRDAGDAAVPTLYLNLADYIAARGPMLSESEWADYCGLVGHILREGLDEKAPQALPKLVDGRDIMEAFALSTGPRVGALIGIVQEAQADGEIATKTEALNLVRSHLTAGGRSA
jgi:poly(A) polymerase